MSSISSLSACLSIAVRSVRESMLHDSENRKKEAFCQYLSNIMYICGTLKDEAWEKDLKGCYSQETLKLFKLSSQCLERAQDLLRTSADNTQLEITSPPAIETPPLPSGRKTSQDGPSIQHAVESQPSSQAPAKQNLPLPSSPSFQRRVQYIDEARRGNIQLLTAYRARMERREKRPVESTRLRRKTDITTLNLGVFRKMAENIEIAKVRQKSLEKRKFERQQRLREEADRRMGPSSSLTTDDQIKKELYVKILEFEQETISFISLRDQLTARPEDSSLIQLIINQVLGTSEHPLTKCLQSYQFEIHKQLAAVGEQVQDLLTHISNLGKLNQTLVTEDKTSKRDENAKLEPEKAKETSFDEELCELLDSDHKISEETSSNDVKELRAEMEQSDREENKIGMGVEGLSEEREKGYRHILESVVKKVQFSLEILHSMFLLVYEPFSTPAGQDLCLALLECAFFKPLWPQLLNLYRVVNFNKEARLAKVFQKNTTCTPESLNVPDRLCLQDQRSDDENPIYPYQPVVDELENLTIFDCPLEKLECIVRTTRVIIECVEEYYEAKGGSRSSTETVIGCDDLLPILCYVIVRSGLAQLVSECHAMEDFISTDYLMGEEGYSLTTFQTALAYLETLEGS